MQRKSIQLVAMAAAASMLAAVPALTFAEDQPGGKGQAVVTVLPQNNAPAAAPLQQQVTVKVNGKASSVTGWQPLRGAHSPVEMVILIDGAARSSLGSQMSDIQHFVQGLPPNTSATIAYMMNGRAALTGPLSTDHAEVLRGLHIPGGAPGVSASPYFCLSDLARNWPSGNRQARREVVMVTDGVDYYNLRYDPDDPYLQAAINDSVRARLTVYSIYWRNMGRVDRSMYETDAGQNLLTQVTEATGGNNYWQGYGNPVSLEPYFSDIERRLNNQYEVSFMAPFTNKPQVETFKLKLTAPGAKVDAPQQVLVLGAESAGGEQ